MFSNSKKVAQQTAQRLISGHYTLFVWWALKHAGVFEAILKFEEESGEGLDPLVFATRTNMSGEILAGLLEYLATAGLLVMKEGRAHLTGEGKALLEHEDGLLEMMRAYEPVLDVVEHLLAKLKPQGAGVGLLRKADALAASQAARYAAEVYPAVQEMVHKNHFSHVLDISCGSGELLIHLATNLKTVVGVGTGADGIMVRQANNAITKKGLEKKLIAVTAGAVDICVDTKRIFDRIGISGQLWEEIDCVIATGLAGEIMGRDGGGSEAVVKVLSAIPRNFPKAHLLLIEPTDSPRFGKNYYAPELALLLRLTRCSPWTPEEWREAIGKSKMRVVQEAQLITDGLTAFLCKPA